MVKCKSVQDEARAHTVDESEKGVSSSSLVSEITRIQISKCRQLHEPTTGATVERVDEKKTEELSSSATLSRHEPSFGSQVAFSHGVLVTAVRSNEPLLTANCCDCSHCRNGRKKEAPGFLSALALSFFQAVINDLCQ